MKILFYVLSVFQFSIASLALTKTEALAQSKSRIEGLKSRFAQLAYNCFMFEEDCQIFGNSQLATLKWLSWDVNQYPPRIEYQSGRDNFLIDGAVRIAKTGSKMGSVVIFNEDLLVAETSPDHFRALTFFEIIGVLIHEFGHHAEESLSQVGLALLSHEQLDEIAVKTVSYLQDRTRTIRIGADDIPGLLEENGLNVLNIEIESYNGVRNIWSNFFIDSRTETKEISALLVNRLTCPRVISNGRIEFIGKPHYFSLRNAHAASITFDKNVLTYQQQIDEASVLCVDDKMGKYQVFSGYRNGLLDLKFSLNEKQQLYFLNGQFTATAPKDEEY